MTPADFAHKTNSYITDYIKFADAKAGGVLTLTIALGTVAAAAAKSLVRDGYAAGVWIYGASCFAGAGVFVSVVLVLWNVLAALRPRTKAAQTSLHSFPDLAGLSPDDAVQQVSALSEAQVTEHLTRHNITLAEVAVQKYRSLASSILWLHAATLCSAALALLYVVADALTPDK